MESLSTHSRKRAELENELKRVVKGEVRFDRGSAPCMQRTVPTTARFPSASSFRVMTKM